MKTQVYNAMLADPNKSTRLHFAETECSTRYGSWQESFTTELEHMARRLDGGLDAIFKDKEILEIGCGKKSGFARLVLFHGARGYVGVDISEEYIKESKKTFKNKRAKFIADEPSFILSAFPGRFLTISSGVMIDNLILRTEQYSEYLVRSIARSTRTGGYAIHQTNPFFDKLFTREGFVDVFPWGIKTRVYRKR